jgi:hypothetical protein
LDLTKLPDCELKFKLIALETQLRAIQKRGLLLGDLENLKPLLTQHEREIAEYGRILVKLGNTKDAYAFLEAWVHIGGILREIVEKVQMEAVNAFCDHTIGKPTSVPN